MHPMRQPPFRNWKRLKKNGERNILMRLATGKMSVLSSSFQMTSRDNEVRIADIGMSPGDGNMIALKEPSKRHFGQSKECLLIVTFSNP